MDYVRHQSLLPANQNCPVEAALCSTDVTSAEPSSWDSLAASATLVTTPCGAPIRTIVTGRRVITTGVYASRKAGRPQPYESMNERAFFMHCERRALRLRLRSTIGELETPQTHRCQKRGQARLRTSPKIEQLGGGGLRIVHAEPRHDGMAPVIPTIALANERLDDGAKPVRPPRGGKRKPKRPPMPPASEDLPDWNVGDLYDDRGWEDAL